MNAIGMETGRDWTHRAQVLVRATPVYTALERYRSWRAQQQGIAGPASPAYKRRLVRETGARYGLRTLIETGTYLGAMVRAQRAHFDHIISIELDTELARCAQRRFRAEAHVLVHQGDSSRVLPRVLRRLERPALFWLDAHYSGGVTARADRDTPIVEEVVAILSHPLAAQHGLLIDDARAFVGANGYPTLDRLRATVRRALPDREVTVDHDIIRVLPTHAGSSVS